MFLAIKEMRHSKVRYVLIVGIMFLISFMVFLLSGLATGLSNEFKEAVVKWQATDIILSKDANNNLPASMLTEKDVSNIKGDETVALGYYGGAVSKDDKQEDVTLFGGEKDAFFIPKVTQGEMYDKKNEIIVSENFLQNGYKIGDNITIGQTKESLKIVGSFAESYYMVTPVIYSSLDTWRQVKFGKDVNQQPSLPISALLSKKQISLSKDDQDYLTQLAIPDYIQEIPGYSAQNLTLTAMIYFLCFIAIAIVGIFMYVITLQKQAIFGVMKVQGISNSYLAKSLMAQSFLVGVIGVLTAEIVAFGISFILPKSMPFSVPLVSWGFYTILLIIAAVIGGVFSIRTITSVDPIKTIGG